MWLWAMYSVVTSLVLNMSETKAPSTLATIIAEFGNYSRRFQRQFVTEFGNSGQKSPKTATVAKFGNSHRNRRHVDRA